MTFSDKTAIGHAGIIENCLIYVLVKCPEHPRFVADRGATTKFTWFVMHQNCLMCGHGMVVKSETLGVFLCLRV